MRQFIAPTCEIFAVDNRSELKRVFHLPHHQPHHDVLKINHHDNYRYEF